MKFDLKKFTQELQTEFQDSLSLKEVEGLLEINEPYNKDNPLSTGKSLELSHISFFGEKSTSENQDYSGKRIDYHQKIETGINIWIADNFKGKSSVLKVIKYALTGRDSLKPNIKKWIKHILLNFSISNKDYTIYLNIEGRLKALLLNGTVKTLAELEEYKNEPLINAKSEYEYQIQIQDFFFKQFSYYSLKWTQKSSVKESNELLESSASWSTYFKSIFLESKDSTSFFGGQDKKVFQMLLGLELTYPINQLTVKKEMLSNHKGKQQLFSEMTIKKQSGNKIELEDELVKINKLIIELNQKNLEKSNINELYSQYNIILQEIEAENSKLLTNENENQSLRKSLSSFQSKLSYNESELKRIKNEIVKNDRKTTDLEEYLDIGIFFSNLDIKHCPSCNHTVSENKKKIKSEEHKCALCSEGIEHSENDLDIEIYTNKIANLKIAGIQFAKEIELLDSDNEIQQNRYNEIHSKLNNLIKQKENFKNTMLLNKQLKDIEGIINIEKEKIKPDDSEKEKYIANKAIIEYKISEIENLAIPNEVINYDKQIELLSNAISKLNVMRYELGKNALKRLEELMLNEIHEFGLNSITEIYISEKFDIQYKQDGDFISFDNIAEGEQLRTKIAFYLSLIQLDIEYNFGRHTRFLMIDSPSKEEADAKYLDGLSNVLKSVQNRFGNQLQILIGTAERGFIDVIENQYITPPETYVF
ncbi:hypothetical protein [Flavobacterium sp. LB2R40]|uniref:hypothetical protein n=1 Tax=Flavobacterium sp. LB2R40 TaxID=3401722 RepID=UPI003AAA3E4C